ncbi:MAG: hypothetical protein MUE63_15560 [Xanthomonadales bacterium]|nr:hypothetical protein [Xanthomonadales bacterium]
MPSTSMRQREHASVGQAEDGGGGPDGGDEDAVARQAALEEERRQGEQPALADVAEHHAEHQHVGDREQQRRVDLAVARRPVQAHQRGERFEPARIARVRGHLGEFCRRRAAQFEEVAAAELALQRPLQPRGVARRDPAGDQRQATLGPERVGRDRGVGAGMNEHAARMQDAGGVGNLLVVHQLALGRHRAVGPGGRRGEILARGFRVGHQLGRHLDVAPAGRAQQRAEFRLLAGRTGDHRMHHFRGRGEHADDESGQAERLGEPRQTRRRQAADFQFEEAFLPRQDGQVEIERGELVQRLQHARNAAHVLLLAAQGVLLAEAHLPELAEKLVDRGQLGQADRLHHGLRVVVGQVAAVLHQLDEAGARRQVDLAIAVARRFGKLRLDRSALVRIEAALGRQQLRGLAEVFLHHPQRHPLHRQWLEHQGVPPWGAAAAGTPRAARMIAGSMPMLRPLSTTWTLRRSCSRSSR